MEQQIIDLLNKHSFSYVPIPKESLNNIYELLINNNEFEPTTNIEMLYIAVHWEFQHDFDKMATHYLLAINHENVSAMINLARNYEKISEFEIAIKYYFMAIATISSKLMNRNIQISNFNDVIKYCPVLIEKHHDGLMGCIANCYAQMSNFDNAIECCLLGIEKGYPISMLLLGTYYHQIEKFDDAIKYYLLAIKNGNNNAMNNLAFVYEQILNFDCAIKYYLMSIETGNVISMNNLAYYYEDRSDFDNMIKYFLMAAECGLEYVHQKIVSYYLNVNIYKNFDEQFLTYLKFEECNSVSILRSIKSMYEYNKNILILHFEYLPEAEGFRDAKRMFEESLSDRTIIPAKN